MFWYLLGFGKVCPWSNMLSTVWRWLNGGLFPGHFNRSLLGASNSSFPILMTQVAEQIMKRKRQDHDHQRESNKHVDVGMPERYIPTTACFQAADVEVQVDFWYTYRHIPNIGKDMFWFSCWWNMKINAWVFFCVLTSVPWLGGIQNCRSS